LWNEKCDNVLKAYETLLKQCYNVYGGTHRKPGQKMFMTLDELERLITEAGIINDLLWQRDIAVCFNLAMQTQINELDSERHLQANYYEFLEVFARCVD